MKRAITFILATVIAAGSPIGLSADIIDILTGNIPVGLRGSFEEVEDFWNTRLIGYNSSVSPQVLAELEPIEITVEFNMIDGPGGILAAAGPDETISWGGDGPKNGPVSNSRVLPTTGTVEIDVDDLPTMMRDQSFIDTVVHEVAHVLGFGTLWEDNNLLQTFEGFDQYVGQSGLEKYREEIGDPFAQFVPLEDEGGGGTAGSHWDEEAPLFLGRDGNNSSDLLTGFIADVNYLTDTSLFSFEDLGYRISSNFGGEGGIAPDLIPKNPRFSTSSPGGIAANATSVPEPSGSILALLFTGLGLVRFRRTYITKATT